MASLRFSTVCIVVALLVSMILFSAFIALIIMVSPNDFMKSLESEEMQYSLRLTISTSLVSTFLAVIIGIPVAYALARKEFPGKNLVRTILDLPMAMPEIVLGMTLLLLFGHTPLAQLLSSIGVKIVFSPLGIVVAQFFSALPYTLRILSTSYETINPRYELVSRSLGYGELETFIKITLPLSKAGLIASTAVAFARSVGAFGAVLILAGGVYMVTETLPITLYLNISYGNLSMAISAGILLIIVSFITIFIIEKIGGGKLWK